MAMGVPGCPELAACTASMESVRIVLMQSISIGVATLGIEALVPVTLILAPWRWRGTENNPAGWLDRFSNLTRILYDRLNRLAAIAAMGQAQNIPDLAHSKPTLLFKRLANWWEPLYINSLLCAYPWHAIGTVKRRRMTWPRPSTLI
jgi:hypothetical protein